MKSKAEFEFESYLIRIEEYYKNGDIAWVTSSATNDLFIEKSESFITKKALKETNCKVYPKGTLLVAMYGQGKTRGQVSELKIDAATNQAICGIFKSHKIDDKYLFSYLAYKKYYLMGQALGGARGYCHAPVQDCRIPPSDRRFQERGVRHGFCDDYRPGWRYWLYLAVHDHGRRQPADLCRLAVLLHDVDGF